MQEPKINRFGLRSVIMALGFIGAFLVFGAKDVFASNCGDFSTTDDRSGWGQEGVYLYDERPYK